MARLNLSLVIDNDIGIVVDISEAFEASCKGRYLEKTLQSYASQSIVGARILQNQYRKKPLNRKELKPRSLITKYCTDAWTIKIYTLRMIAKQLQLTQIHYLCQVL